jgi:hypothetical protein
MTDEAKESEMEHPTTDPPRRPWTRVWDRAAEWLTPVRAVVALVVLAGVLGIITVVNHLTAAASAPDVPTAAETLSRITVAPGSGLPEAHTQDCYPDVEPWSRCDQGRIPQQVVFAATPEAGRAACATRIAGSPPGWVCIPRLVNTDPNGGPGHYVEYDDNQARGVQRCVNTLRHDLNLRATCQVQPFVNDPITRRPPVG